MQIKLLGFCLLSLGLKIKIFLIILKITKRILNGIPRINRDGRSLYFTLLAIPFPRSLVSFQLPVSAGRAIRAQNFNYLRKISIDPWREIERPAMKRG